MPVVSGGAWPPRLASNGSYRRRGRGKIATAVERSLGFDPTDREFEKRGYDIESRVPGTGKLRFIEVKGRISGEANILATRNEGDIFAGQSRRT